MAYELDTSDALTSSIIDISSTGDNTVVSGTASQSIKVYKMFLAASATVGMVFKDGTTGRLTGTMFVTSFSLDEDREPWFTLTSGSAFVINLSGTTQVSGRVYYITD